MFATGQRHSMVDALINDGDIVVLDGKRTCEMAKQQRSGCGIRKKRPSSVSILKRNAFDCSQRTPPMEPIFHGRRERRDAERNIGLPCRERVISFELERINVVSVDLRAIGAALRESVWRLRWFERGHSASLLALSSTASRAPSRDAHTTSRFLGHRYFIYCCPLNLSPTKSRHRSRQRPDPNSNPATRGAYPGHGSETASGESATSIGSRPVAWLTTAGAVHGRKHRSGRPSRHRRRCPGIYRQHG